MGVSNFTRDRRAAPDISGWMSGQSYRARLDSDSRWALSEGSRFFDEKSSVQEARRKVTSRLDSLNIPYAVAGGLALFQHGYRRFTEDVDLLVTRDGFDSIHASLGGLGYKRPFPGSKSLQDTDLGVRIEFLVTGDFPGDGKAKPVSFPAPDAAAIEVDGIRYLKLPMLIQLKLASGMTNLNRMKDLTDVIELIKVLALPKSLATQLDPYVRKKFRELWDQTRSVARSFVRFCRDDLVTTGERQRMLQDGVVIVPEGDHVWLQTTDPEVARRYGMEEDDR